ncbi:MAG: hypothetical protein SPJ34_07715 [Candidatus Ornithospirochaeta sp.]|nr:hypothetical protein [Candidatus Ornithospirochaeta sp.]
MRKSIMTAAMLLISAQLVFSASLEEIFQKAEENSPSYRNTVLANSNSQLALEQLELDDKAVYSVSAAVRPGLKGSEGINVTELTASVTLPDDGATRITVSSPFSVSYDASSYAVSPSISASHSFDFGYSGDALRELTIAQSKLTLDNSSMKAELSFRKSVLETMKTLYSSLQTLEKTRKNLRDAEKALEDNLALKAVSEDSVSYQQSMISIDKLKASVDALEKQYDNAKENYRTLTGLEWDGVDDLPDPVLNLIVLDTGNTDVINASLSAQMAEENYRIAYSKYNPSSIVVSGGVSSSAGRSAGSDARSISAQAGASYVGNGWSVGADLSGSWSMTDGTFSPAVSLKGSWKSNSTSQSDEIELQKLQNKYIIAQNEYISKLTQYTQDGQGYAISIMNWNYRKAQQDAQDAYLAADLLYKETLLNRGLGTEKVVEDARFEVEMAGYDRMILMLEGLSLEYSLRIFAL